MYSRIRSSIFIITIILITTFAVSCKNEKKETLTIQDKADTTVQTEAFKAVSELDIDKASTRDIAVAINYYIWRNYNRSASASGSDPVGIIKAKDAQCQGRVILMSYLLDVFDIESRMVALWDFPQNSGGTHSLIEVKNEDSYMLFDPLNGGYFTETADLQSRILPLKAVLNSDVLYHQVPLLNGAPASHLIQAGELPKVYAPKTMIYAPDLKYSVGLGISKKTLSPHYTGNPNIQSTFSNGKFHSADWVYVPMKWMPSVTTLGEIEDTNQSTDWDELPYAAMFIYSKEDQRKGLYIKFPKGKFKYLIDFGWINRPLTLKLDESSYGITPKSISVAPGEKTAEFTIDNTDGNAVFKVNLNDNDGSYAFVGFDAHELIKLK